MAGHSKVKKKDAAGWLRFRLLSPEGGVGTSSLIRTSEVLRLTGISHQVLYRYITLGLVEPSSTAESGQRLFHPMVVDLIELIQSLNESGYTLRDIKDIFFKEERVKKAVARRPGGST
jgi:hypothetical protein